MATFRVDLNDDGAFADYLAAQRWDRESFNHDLLEILHSITCGARENLWWARRTKRGGTTLAFRFADDRGRFVQAVESL